MHQLRFIIVIFCCFVSGFTLYGQNTDNEQVKRLQRAIFIYNIAEQVSWNNNDSFDTVTIGVLGKDRTVLDLRVMSQKRKIDGKPVAVKRFDKVMDIDDVQVLYVNDSFNFDINYILQRISGRNMLLISEDYNYNTSMVNMVNVGDSFEYEINESLLIAQNFTYQSSLQEYAVNSSEKWKALFATSQEALDKKKEQVNLQSEVILEKNETIELQDQDIRKKEKEIRMTSEALAAKRDSILQLVNTNSIQLQKYEEKVLTERELERTIMAQLEVLNGQQQIIDSTANYISSQRHTLEQQDKEIAEKQSILIEKDAVIRLQRKTNTLLAIIAGLFLLAGILIYRSYLANKKLSEALTLKNQEVEAQTIELKHKNIELEQFAYIASHDLQEPLNTISSLIGMLKEDYGEVFDDVGLQSLDYLDSSSTRMRNLINALLKHSKLGVLPDVALVDIDALLVDIQKDLSGAISKRNAEIIVEDLPTVMGSRVELGVVFQNLISNAIKFSHPNTTPVVMVSASRTEDQKFWEISVSDNGIGISAKYQDRIFAIFQRLHNAETYEGTGIGLAHVKKIVESHGGTIRVSSEEGNGSTFYFTLPIHELR
ncbi:MAG: YfiR/HmsC family protein [Bacteroidetes bacterium]|nr:YfiR/HmsC family protein [Bacteroidota bacterium]